ncbi:MAG: helix-turn-helix transcriptional regulator [Caldilineaceae bacterium]|nr:helix-turn-helix transcriptional regulator [Caldilineaceae bacterium]
MSATFPESTTAILRPAVAKQKFSLARHAPAEDLVPFVASYWLLHWDLPADETHVQEIVPYPCVNLVIESSNGVDRGDVFGVYTPIYKHELMGQGCVFGIKFQPAGFYPFVNSPMHQLTNKSRPLMDLFGAAGCIFQETILALDCGCDGNRSFPLAKNSGSHSELSINDEQARIAAANQFLLERLPPVDETIFLLNEVVAAIINDRTLTRVEAVAEQANSSVRTLQRLFRTYMGVSPKQIIRQCRLQEAAARMDMGESLDLAQLALTLGYFDQAHFTRDFTAMVGVSPTQYAADALSFKSINWK